MDANINRLKGWIALYLVVVSVLIVPFYIQDGYLTLVETKACLYLRLVSPALFAGGFLVFLSAFRKLFTFVKSKEGGAGEPRKGQGAAFYRLASSVLLCAIGK